MFNYLLMSSFTNYFNTTSTRGIELITSLALIGALLIGLAIIFLLKKDLVAKYLKISTYIIVAFALSIIVANIAMSIKDGTFDEMDCRGYLETVDFMYIAIIGTILLLIVLFAIPLFFDKQSKISKDYSRTKSITYAGICIALAFGLSYIRIFKAPYGGSITLASILPIAIYSYLYGSRKGLICGLIYGLLQFIQEPYFYHILQFLLDYPIAFGFIGMCGGLFRNKLKPIFAVPLGILLGVIGRFASHFISGAVFFGVWAPEGFANIWTYSAIYNSLYVFPDAAIAIAASIALLSSKTVCHQLESIQSTKKDQANLIQSEDSTLNK